MAAAGDTRPANRAVSARQNVERLNVNVRDCDDRDFINVLQRANPSPAARWTKSLSRGSVSLPIKSNVRAAPILLCRRSVPVDRGESRAGGPGGIFPRRWHSFLH